MTNRPDDLEADLDRLAETDPAVREAAEQLDWTAQKAAMGWPRRFENAPLPDDIKQKDQ